VQEHTGARLDYRQAAADDVDDQLVRDQVTGGHDAPCLLADRRAARDLSTQDVARGQALQGELLLDPRRLGALAADRRSEDDADHWTSCRNLIRHSTILLELPTIRA